MASHFVTVKCAFVRFLFFSLFKFFCDKQMLWNPPQKSESEDDFNPRLKHFYIRSSTCVTNMYLLLFGVFFFFSPVHNGCIYLYGISYEFAGGWVGWNSSHTHCRNTVPAAWETSASLRTQTREGGNTGLNGGSANSRGQNHCKPFWI